MERIDLILSNEIFREHLQKIEEWEKDRKFCKHSSEHFMDVARIGWILNLEENLEIPKDLFYAAALLHDIGRDVQYQDETPHEKASAEIAPVILKQCDYSEEEIKEITEAIAAHRDQTVAAKKDIRGILYRADKLSRECYFCKVNAECNWKNDKKNRRIIY